MSRLILNTKSALIQRFHIIMYRLTNHKDTSNTGHSVIVDQMCDDEVAMLEGELKEIKIKMSLMGVPEPVMKNKSLHGLAAEQVNDKST